MHISKQFVVEGLHSGPDTIMIDLKTNTNYKKRQYKYNTNTNAKTKIRIHRNTNTRNTNTNTVTHFVPSDDPNCDPRRFEYFDFDHPEIDF